MCPVTPSLTQPLCQRHFGRTLMCHGLGGGDPQNKRSQPVAFIWYIFFRPWAAAGLWAAAPGSAFLPPWVARVATRAAKPLTGLGLAALAAGGARCTTRNAGTVWRKAGSAGRPLQRSLPSALQWEARACSGGEGSVALRACSLGAHPPLAWMWLAHGPHQPTCLWRPA